MPTFAPTGNVNHLVGVGTPLVAGDIALAAGWGTTASVSAVNATDMGGTFLITSSGTGQGANPQVTITFKSAYTVQPKGIFAMLSWGTGSAVAEGMFMTDGRPGTTSVVFAIAPLIPVAATTYGLVFFVIG